MTIKAGRAAVRRSLYMAVVVAIRWDSDFKSFYGRLRAAGKPSKVTIAAAMRKLIILASTLLKDDRDWSPTPP